MTATQTKKINSQNVQIDQLKADQVVSNKIIADNREISIKEVYSKVMILQGKFDAVADNNKSQLVRFSIFTYTIIIIEIINLIFNIILWLIVRSR